MAISDGYKEASADVNSLFTSSLNSLASDNATYPAVWWWNTTFVNTTSSSSLSSLTRNFIIPDDDFTIKEIAVTSVDHVGVFTLTIDNGALIEVIELEQQGQSGLLKAPRYYDGTKPLQTFLRGSEGSITLSTANVTTPNRVRVSLGFYSMKWRER